MMRSSVQQNLIFWNDQCFVNILPEICFHFFDKIQTNSYMANLLENAKYFLTEPEFKILVNENYFDPLNIEFRDRDIYQYMDGVAANDAFAMREGAARRLLRNLVEIFEEDSFNNLKNRIAELESYFKTQYPGKKDLPYIQQLKGMTREWEADILWGYFGFKSESVIHSRLGFYKGDIFTEEPEVGRDVMPILNTIKKINPNIITVALDPEGSGPDTHYKVLQAVSSALQLHREETGKQIFVYGDTEMSGIVSITVRQIFLCLLPITPGLS